jgi:hypothetical protein
MDTAQEQVILHKTCRKQLIRESSPQAIETLLEHYLYYLQ